MMFVTALSTLYASHVLRETSREAVLAFSVNFVFKEALQFNNKNMGPSILQDRGKTMEFLFNASIPDHELEHYIKKILKDRDY
jgi:hypothetical protein